MKNLILSGGMVLFCITAKEIRANTSVIVNKILLAGIPVNMLWKVPMCSNMPIWQIASVPIKGQSDMLPLSSICIVSMPMLKEKKNDRARMRAILFLNIAM